MSESVPDTTFYVAHCPHGYNAIVMRGEAMHVERDRGYPYPVVPCDRPTLVPE
jgi:hypothetical protein